MRDNLLIDIARRLMRQPAVPYFEQGVRAEAIRICREHGLAHTLDPFGNLLVRLNTAPRLRPLALAAHLDHPGFHLKHALGGKWVAQFHGGVAAGYFKPGLAVRLMPGAIAAKLRRRLPGDRRFLVEAKLPAGVRPGFAVWELEDFALRRGRIIGRACDDLIGVATILATMVELKRHHARVNVLGVITRAEEVGFHGALMIARRRAIPRRALVISLETSRELPPVKQGAGVIVRVGDRSSVFDSDGTRFLTEVAADLAKRDGKFKFQRALMSGGSCEGTAFQEYGYQTAAVCVALGNYHNCAPGNRIAAEFVSAADALGMQSLLVSTARRMAQFGGITGRLNTRLDRLAREAQRRFRRFG